MSTLRTEIEIERPAKLLLVFVDQASGTDHVFISVAG